MAEKQDGGELVAFRGDWGVDHVAPYMREVVARGKCLGAILVVVEEGPDGDPRLPKVTPVYFGSVTSADTAVASLVLGRIAE